MRAARQEMQEWRNWQTRRLQVPVVARSCGFKSHLLHYFFALRIKNWSGGPIQITLPGMMQKLPGRVFLFLCGEDVQTGKENRRISDSVKLFKIIAIIHIFHKIKKN